MHGISADKVHFHEVGALDAIVDIVGAVAGLDLLGVQKVYCSRIALGKGFVKCQHGLIPTPAPAVVKLLEGFEINLEYASPIGGYRDQVMRMARHLQADGAIRPAPASERRPWGSSVISMALLQY